MVERGGAPDEHDSLGRTDAAPGRGSPRDVQPAPADQADGSADDARTDAPADLSAHSHPADIQEAGLSDEEIAAYRRRVAEGFYNSPGVADEVARRMLRSGDI